LGHAWDAFDEWNDAGPVYSRVVIWMIPWYTVVVTKTQTICPDCRGCVRGQKQSTKSLQAALAVHTETCPGKKR